MLGNIIVFIISYLIGVFGFSQIIGSLQNIKERGIKMTIITSLIWIIILGILIFIIYSKFNSNMISSAIALIISLIQVVSTGRIQ